LLVRAAQLEESADRARRMARTTAKPPTWAPSPPRVRTTARRRTSARRPSTARTIGSRSARP